jgi:D-alanyl-D-alanine dipeptidase
LNQFVKGSLSSQHCTGEAIDIDMDGSSNGVTNKMIFDFIKEKLDFDQLIWEFGTDSNPDWVHVSYTKTGNRKQKLKAVRSGGKTTYIPI